MDDFFFLVFKHNGILFSRPFFISYLFPFPPMRIASWVLMNTNRCYRFLYCFESVTNRVLSIFRSIFLMYDIICHYRSDFNFITITLPLPRNGFFVYYLKWNINLFRREGRCRLKVRLEIGVFEKGVLNGATKDFPNGIPSYVLNCVPNDILNGVPNGVSNGVPNGVQKGISKCFPNLVENGV